ncbi:hypothetical protein BGZ94_005653, partial [Podila epigama]
SLSRLGGHSNGAIPPLAQKWRLASGTVVEDVLLQAGLELAVDHPIRNFMIGLTSRAGTPSPFSHPRTRRRLSPTRRPLRCIQQKQQRTSTPLKTSPKIMDSQAWMRIFALA